jgi:NAD(P)-dependent dehydrogenase (short-subunit alcohol dehydrogenase family)
MRYYATTLAEKNIRVNSVHPASVDTPVIVNDEVGRYLSKHPELGLAMAHLLPVAQLDVDDIAEAMVFLVAGRGATSPA